MIVCHRASSPQAKPPKDCEKLKHVARAKSPVELGNISGLLIVRLLSGAVSL